MKTQEDMVKIKNMIKISGVLFPWIFHIKNLYQYIGEVNIQYFPVFIIF